MKIMNIALAAALVAPALAFGATEKWDLTGKLTPENKTAVQSAVQSAAQGAKVSFTGNTLVVDGKSINKSAIEAAVARATAGTPATETTPATPMTK